jgi:uncharacterized protein YueI
VEARGLALHPSLSPIQKNSGRMGDSLLVLSNSRPSCSVCLKLKNRIKSNKKEIKLKKSNQTKLIKKSKKYSKKQYSFWFLI